MSAVAYGTRLEQLIALRNRIDLEIKAERRRQDGGRIRTQETRKRTPGGDGNPEERMAALGVDSHTVKQWAVDVGLATDIRRGRTSHDLVDAYIEANHPHLWTDNGELP